MGLLDDAIREHMELKRLRGADPGEVARQEHDALGPVVREHNPEEPGTFEDPLFEEVDGDHRDEEAHPVHGDLGHVDPAHGDGAHPAHGDLSMDPSSDLHPERGPDFASVGQETAELDMRTVLDEQHEVADRAGQIDSAGLGGAAGEDESPIPGEMPGQERLWLDQQQTSRDFDFDG